MAVLMPEGKQSFADSAGLPLVGGKLFTYDAGTSNPRPTYVNSGGISQNTNPIILDGRGEATIFWQGAYKAVLTDAAGATIWTVDNIVSTDTLIDASSSLVTQLRSDLANTTDPLKGDALVGVKRDDIAGAVALTLHEWNKRASINVRQVGVTGDGSNDDAALLNTLGALGVPLYIPYTSTTYKIGSTVTFNCDVYCEGIFTPTTAIGGAANDYNRFAIILASAGFGVGRRFVGLRVAGSGPLRAANVSGIRNDCEDSVCRDFKVTTLNYGIVARSYSQTYDRCSAQLCNVNFGAYARSTSLEINALSIRGGTWDSAVTAAMIIGDTSWSDAMASGANPHGVGIQITDEPSFDGNEVRIDNVFGVRIGGYFEGSTSGIAIKLGGSADGRLRDVTIEKCYFSTVQFAVKCLTAVQGIYMQPSFYTAVSRCALYVPSDLYPTSYERGTQSGSFSQGQEVHTGFRSLGIASVTWGNMTIPYQGLIFGAQNCTVSPGMWYPGGLKQLAGSITRMNASTAGRFYDTPSPAKNGTVAGSVFTFTTLADCYAFNGGDRIVTVPAGAVYVRSVDYAAGTMVIDGGVTAAGAATVSQELATFI